MKYLRYILILVIKLIGKLVGVPMFYLLLPFRAYARNRVYNYVLQNNVYLKRLEEKEYKLSGFGYLSFIKFYSSMQLICSCI